MANQDDKPDTAPWTIKSVGVHTRKMATDCATREGVTMGEWMDRMVPVMAAMQDGNQVVLPDQRRSAAVPLQQAMAMLELERLDALGRLATAVASATAAGVPKGAVREISALLREQARAARGLPAPANAGKVPGKQMANRATGSLLEG